MSEQIFFDVYYIEYVIKYGKNNGLKKIRNNFWYKGSIQLDKKFFFFVFSLYPIVSNINDEIEKENTWVFCI